MPQIEVVPNSTTGATPGWAYVPDSRFDPSQAAIKPTGGRKRGARDLGAGGRVDKTSRQNAEIVKHLAALDRENHREAVHIPIPTKKQESRGMSFEPVA